MSTLQRAIEIAVERHKGQTRAYENVPYYVHPLRVMQRVSGEDARIVAVLHDVIEDTGMTLEDLRNEGFTQEVATAVEVLSRREGESYAAFVQRCKQNPLARLVKLADLEDNFNLPGTRVRAEHLNRDLQRLCWYVLSAKYLQDELDDQTFLAAMAEQGAA